MNDNAASAHFLKAIAAESQRPQNFRIPEHPTHQAKGYNRVCGDAVTVYVTVDDDTITDAAFQGDCCAVCRCSASKLTQLVAGLAVKEYPDVLAAFEQSLCGAPTDDDNAARLKDSLVLTGVRAYPSRIPCATLAWQTLRAALNDEPETSTE